MERDRGIGPRLVGPPGREGVAVQRFRARELSGETRETGQVDQVRRRDVVATVATIERQCRVELPPRFLEITEPLHQQTEIVVIRRGAPRVPDAVAQRQRLGVVVARY